MAKHNCLICNKQGYLSYWFCEKHLEMRTNGEIEKCENCGKWYIIANGCDCNKKSNNTTNNNGKCLLCGEKIDDKYMLCYNCDYNVDDRMEELDKNQKPFKLKDYYYNAKNYALKLFDEDKVYNQQLTMLAIANILDENYKDDTLYDRVERDILTINENLSNKTQKLNEKIKENSVIEEIKIDSDNEKAKIKRTQDGHFVESEYEIKVDDILYYNNIVHAYNIKVDDIAERTIMCDWYLPVLRDKGIYIELWGVSGNKKYNENKEEKINLYKKYNLNLIQIELDELKNDTSRLKSNLLSQIKHLKQEILQKEM